MKTIHGKFVLGAAAFAFAPQAMHAAERPNIIFILADDMGWGDIGALGQKGFKTPNLDRMISEGMFFTRHYDGAPVSAPSRCVLMTGKHTGHSSIRGNKSIPGVGVAPLHPSDITIPEALHEAGYITAMCGRWHLGGELTNQTPFHRGFDYHFGKLSSNFRNKHGVLVDEQWDENGKHIPYAQYSKLGYEPVYCNGKLYDLQPGDKRPVNLDRLVTDKAIDYIGQPKDKPFFLYVAFCLPHGPMEYHEATPVPANDWPETERAFASMMQSLDKYVGEIIEAVDKAGIGKNTLIVFVSDNGAHSEDGHDYRFFRSTGNYRGFKRDLYDGGDHAPMIARWTGTIRPGSTSDHLCAFWDWQATMCDLAGIEPPKDTDGLSFAPVFYGKKPWRSHDFLYWEFPEKADRKHPGPEFKQSVLFDNWKFIHYLDTNVKELYDLSTDVAEEHNLADKYPDLVEKALYFIRISHEQNPIFPMTRTERNLPEFE